MRRGMFCPAEGWMLPIMVRKIDMLPNPPDGWMIAVGSDDAFG